MKSVHVSSAVLDADAIVELPKLKTHSFTTFTGAVKNMFGVIPCGVRHELHGRFPGSGAFGRMLVDIFACVPPRLTVMDAILAMEGPGETLSEGRASSRPAQAPAARGPLRALPGPARPLPRSRPGRAVRVLASLFRH